MLRHSLRIALFVVLLAIISSCNGSSSDTSESNNNIGWVGIGSSNIWISADDIYVDMRGYAFVSNGYVAHRCVGLCCLVCDFDDSYPGVEVWWQNTTTGTGGSAESQYGTATNWNHRWYATISLVAGDNNILIYASDPGEGYGEEQINITYVAPAPVEIFTEHDDRQVTLSWTDVPHASSYNIYWQTMPGVDNTNGIKISGVASPYTHGGLINGIPYYYVITTNSPGGESEESDEVWAIPSTP